MTLQVHYAKQTVICLAALRAAPCVSKCPHLRLAKGDMWRIVLMANSCGHAIQ
jgi:hypothetical protein